MHRAPANTAADHVDTGSRSCGLGNGGSHAAELGPLQLLTTSTRVAYVRRESTEAGYRKSDKQETFDPARRRDGATVGGHRAD